MKTLCICFVTWVLSLTAVSTTAMIGCDSPDTHPGDGKPATPATPAPPAAPAPNGTTVYVDPAHRFRFEHPPNPPVEERIALHEGEKARTIWVSFPAPLETSGTSGGRGVLPYILAGAAGVAFASFAYFGIKGKAAADACHGQCTSEEAAPITHQLMVADISLITGLVLGGAAAWLFLSRPAPPVGTPAPVSLEIVPRRRVSSTVRCEALQ